VKKPIPATTTALTWSASGQQLGTRVNTAQHTPAKGSLVDLGESETTTLIGVSNLRESAFSQLAARQHERERSHCESCGKQRFRRRSWWPWQLRRAREQLDGNQSRLDRVKKKKGPARDKSASWDGGWRVKQRKSSRWEIVIALYRPGHTRRRRRSTPERRKAGTQEKKKQRKSNAKQQL
jgi:hypothetical protein